MKKLYKGIEPIIAVVILVAVTLVIAIGVIGWIMGWWGTFGASESIKTFPDSYIDVSTQQNNLVLHLKNEGSAASVIYKIEVVGLKTLETSSLAGATTVSYSTPANCATKGNNDVTVGAGCEATLNINLGATATAGTLYNVKIYTRAGNVISVTVQGKIPAA